MVKTIKKLLGAIIALILYLCLCFPVALSARAASLAKVTFNDVAARKGDTIEIIVSLSGCQAIKSMAVVPLYNSERLEYKSGAWLIGNALLSDWDQEKQNGVILYSSETDVNGDIAKFVFQLADHDSWEDIDFSCKVVLKNGNNTIDVEVDTLKIFIICDHKWKDEVLTKNATCAEEGYTYKLCSICKREDKLTAIERIPHTESDWIIDKEATAEEEGLRHKECLICNAMLEDGIIPRLGLCNHVWGEEVFVKEPTRSESGSVYKTCQICGESLKLFDLERLGMKPWLVAVIAAGTGVGVGIVFMICFLVVLKRRKY